MIALVGVLLVTGLSSLPGLPGLSPGSYRLDVEVVVVASVPVLGQQRTTTKTTSVLLLDEANLATARACRVETKGPGFRSRMPPASLRTLPLSRFRIEEDGQVVRADMGEGRIGFQGAGPLPQSAKDPRVADPDGDGEPGVQLLLDLGGLGVWTLQIVSQGRTAFEGRLTPTGAEGRLSFVRSEEKVLSGLPVKLPARADAIDGQTSRFVLVRVAHGDESFCAW